MMRACFLLFSLIALPLVAANAPVSDTNLPERHYRPDPIGQPTVVSYNLFLLDILSIDDVSGTITIDYLFALRWNDPRLADDQFDNPDEKLNLTINDIWNPQIVSVNLRESMMSDQLVSITPNGDVTYRQRNIATYSAPLDLRHFPFDEQTIRLKLLSSVYTADAVTLQWDPARSGQLGDFSLRGWSFEGFGAETFDQELRSIEQTTHNPTGIEFTLDLKRKPAFYIWKVFFPLGLIAFMAWTVFWIDPANFGGQIAISTSSVITLIAFQLSLSELLPRISYLTNIDLYAVGTSLLVFLALGESILTARLAKIEKHALSLSIDRHMRWIYPVAYALLTFIVVI